MKIRTCLIISILSIATFLCLATGVYLLYDHFFNPFQSVKERETKAFYQYSIENFEKKIKLKAVMIDSDYIDFYCTLKNPDSASNFNERELHMMNMVLMQACDYLNKGSNIMSQYHTVIFTFNAGVGAGAEDIEFYLVNTNSYYTLEEISNDIVCELSQLAVFDSVKVIRYNGIFQAKDELMCLSNLKNLRELRMYFGYTKEEGKEFLDLMKTILLDCMVYLEGKEF